MTELTYCVAAIAVALIMLALVTWASAESRRSERRIVQARQRLRDSEAKLFGRGR